MGKMGEMGERNEIDRQLKRMYPIEVGVATNRSESGITLVECA